MRLVEVMAEGTHAEGATWVNPFGISYVSQSKERRKISFGVNLDIYTKEPMNELVGRINAAMNEP